MSLPAEFPAWMFLYFASMGTIALVLVAVIFWTWITALPGSGPLRQGLGWNAAGTALLFSAMWFACGVGAGPGNLLSPDSSIHQPFLAGAAAVAGMFCSVAGLLCLLIGIRSIRSVLLTGQALFKAGDGAWQRHQPDEQKPVSYANVQRRAGDAPHS